MECAMKGFCEWFRDMPIMVCPNISVELPTISKWSRVISDVFSWYLCDYEHAMCDCQCHRLCNVCCK